jgi:bacterioferritin
MKASNKIIDQLNFILSKELTAMEIYFIQHRMCYNWGLTKLAARFEHEMNDEKLHADLLIKRIVFLGGTPNLVSRDSYDIPGDVLGFIKLNHEYEIHVANILKESITIFENEMDYNSRKIIEKLLKDTEEDHIIFYETQLRLIKEINIEMYLQSMI